MQGSPAVGYLPPCGLWAPKQVPFQSLEDALSDGFRDAHELMFNMRPSEHDEAAREAGEKDEACGFCTPEFGWDDLLAERRSFRLIRRFVIEQSSGKKRVIDDAASGLQSHFSSDANQLRFCSALQPCLHLQCLYGALASPTQSWPDDLVSFGEDLPQAYRKIPLAPDHSWACIVAYYSPEKQAVRFRRYHGLLFGLPLAVTCFNRLSFFLQSMIRRILMALGSFYFDDLSVQDWCSSAPHCQACVQRLCEHLGYPSEKQRFLLPQPISWALSTTSPRSDLLHPSLCGLGIVWLARLKACSLPQRRHRISHLVKPASCMDVSLSSTKEPLAALPEPVWMLWKSANTSPRHISLIR